MFTLQAKPNPLATFGGHLAQGLADKYSENQEMAQRNAEIKKGFAALGENPSRMEILQTIEGLRIPDEQKKRLYEGFGDIEKDKLTREKSKQEAEKSEKKQVRAKKLAQTYGISEEEAEGLEPSDIAALGRHRAKQEPGGPGAQPIPPQIVEKMKEVRAKNPESTGKQLLREMDDAGIPRRWSEPEAKLQSEQDAIKSQDPYFKAAQSQQAKANVAQSQDVLRQGDAAGKELLAIEGMRRNIKSTGFNLRNKLADLFGQPSWKDPNSEEFKSYTKQTLMKAADIVRGKVSNFEFQTIGDLYANADKSQAANEALLDWQYALAKTQQIRGKEASKILKENRGIPPPDFTQQVDDKSDGPTQKIIEEWRRKKDKYEAKVFKRKVVKPGTPIDESIATTYLIKAKQKLPGGNEEQVLDEAEKMAKEDGYEF